MALTNSYLATTKNLASILTSLQSAKAPERFSTKFLTDLGFSSSNDRLVIGVLKALGFLDESGVPTKRYFAYLDQGESGRILADSIREGYEDLFAINKKAHLLSAEDIKNKLKTLTQGQKSDNVIGLMSATFKALCELADWTAPPHGLAHADAPLEHQKSMDSPKPIPALPAANVSGPMKLHYDFHIHLPESRDPAVYDAIFQALRVHIGP
ncbi:hypothetical protein SAMN04515618_117100 [Collimonas sp. OK307]|uniref:DUF5343 domain-containing protein n=1 Tax=Collimonas sp. OK307 TaxID=1801620 RepID=UPI0008E0DF15|nr:DUF5343 domain-containing protein [Collimonas sp. OK307]SFI32900.1 hypothetical protein SAMN04515618_117100 [Collimonas sp. OK307]